MKVRIIVGSVDMRLDGLDLTKRDVIQLLHKAAAVSIVLPTEPVEATPVSDTYTIGFTGEKAPEYVAQNLDWYFEE